jgi:hypothetical protein
MTSIVRPRREPQISPKAVDRWRRMQALERACTCPDPASKPYPGNVCINGVDPDPARRAPYLAERARYDQQRAACEACPQWAIEHAALLADLGIRLRPWEGGIHARVELVAALERGSTP